MKGNIETPTVIAEATGTAGEKMAAGAHPTIIRKEDLSELVT